MRFLNNLAISTQLLLLGAISGGVALLFCGLGFVIEDISTFHNAEALKIHNQAEILAFNSPAILKSRDAEAAKRLLSALRLQSSVELGCLYDDQGQILACYVKENHTARVIPPCNGLIGTRFTKDGNLEFGQAIIDNGRPVGTLFLRANMNELQGQLWGYAKVVAMTLICSLAVSVLLSAGLQRGISQPILALSEAARHVTQEGDYSIRVDTKAGAELGNLCQAFNSMLSQVEASKDALRESNDRLEERVKQRTIELEEEITRRQAAQDDLEKSRDEAETANRAKSEFLANMSHEIRTPLNGILGFSELLMKGGKDLDEEELLDFAQTINSSGKHLLTLVNDILDLSKIEAERLENERVECSLQELIGEVLSVLRVKAQEKNITLECECRGNTPETIRTDPARLRQLLTNVVGNAIKFTDAGSVRLISSFNHEFADSKMTIEIVDTGIGIPPDKIDAIFNPFVQADNSVTRKYGGTGLGLAISRRIARALGGDLTAQSTSGKGSTFTVTIDSGDIEGVAMISEGSAEAVRTKRNKSKTGDITLPPIEILLVEDGDTNQKLISLVLRRAGANVTTADNGQIGVNLATEMEFDLILMDMQMPVMDGYTAAGLLRQRGATMPIIALTAHAMKGDEEKCRSAGCSGFLTKPIDTKKLLLTIRDAVADTHPTADDPLMDDSPLVSSLPMDDPDFREIVEEFVGRLNVQLAAMRRAWKDENLEELKVLAHWLKGSGGTVGLTPLTAPAKQLEEAVKLRQFDQIETSLMEIATLADRIVIPTV